MKQSVRNISRYDLMVVDQPWAFAHANRDAIDAHWSRRHAENPKFFNGIIHLMFNWHITQDALTGSLLRTDFKSYLFWRESAFPDAGVVDCFGGALLRGACGGILLGRQRSGNVNGGQSYLPGGFLDQRDVSADGRVDIEGSIARELDEEMGINAASLARQPGYWLTEAGPLCALAIEYRSDLDLSALAELGRRHIAADPASELEAFEPVCTLADMRQLSMPPYARLLLNHVLA